MTDTTPEREHGTVLEQIHRVLTTKAYQNAPDSWMIAEELLKFVRKYSDTATDLSETAADLADAIRLTVEYIGNDTLPALPGWSWFDALNRYNPDMVRPFIEHPIILHKAGVEKEHDATT
jgi:hypothetical protein